MYIERLVKRFVDYQIIEEKDKELYYFGLKQAIVLLYNFLTILLISFLFKMTLEGMIFMVVYSVLRPYAGGYHAKTQRRCYLISIIMMVVALWLIRQDFWSNLNCLIVMIISSSIVFVLAPVEDENKPLDDIEKKVFRKRIVILLNIFILLTALFWVINLKQIAICVIVSVGMLSIMLILGQVKYYINKNSKRENIKLNRV